MRNAWLYEHHLLKLGAHRAAEGTSRIIHFQEDKHLGWCASQLLNQGKSDRWSVEVIKLHGMKESEKLEKVNQTLRTTSHALMSFDLGSFTSTGTSVKGRHRRQQQHADAVRNQRAKDRRALWQLVTKRWIDEGGDTVLWTDGGSDVAELEFSHLGKSTRLGYRPIEV